MRSDLDWERIRDYVRREIVIAGYGSQQALADAMPSFTLRSLNDFLTGKSTLRDSNLTKLEVALSWEAGSAKDIGRGGEPRRVSEPATAHRPAASGSAPIVLTATFDELLHLQGAVAEVFDAATGEEFLRRALQLRAAHDQQLDVT